MKTQCDVIVVGGGASGLLCAVMLARKGVQVTVLEKNHRIGKKLSATGNGRCNFTNLHMNENCYYGNSKFISHLLTEVSAKCVIAEFEKYGILHREKDGYVYPHTNQAATVVNGLYHACTQFGVIIYEDCEVEQITKKKEFLVHTSKGDFNSTYVVLATGGKAGKESGGSESGYSLAESFHHTVTKLYPGLTGLVCDGVVWNKTAGTRVQGTISLMIDGKTEAFETGEIQIVKNGVSGIPVFQMCRIAAKALDENRLVEGVIDFVPSLSKEEVKNWIKKHGVEGLMPQKWVPLCKRAKNPVEFVKFFRFVIRDTFGMERAQVTAGGVPVEEVVQDSMESKKEKQLYLLGELLDVDGICGGYNLHFAWSTAMIAAKHILQLRKENEK